MSFSENLLIVRSDPGNDLDSRLVHRRESLSILLGILVWDGADEVVALAVFVDLVKTGPPTLVIAGDINTSRSLARVRRDYALADHA
jgi:hypothetical protein